MGKYAFVRFPYMMNVGVRCSPQSKFVGDNRTQEQKWKDEKAKLAKSKSKQKRKYKRMIKAYPNMRKEEDFK